MYLVYLDNITNEQIPFSLELGFKHICVFRRRGGGEAGRGGGEAGRRGVGESGRWEAGRRGGGEAGRRRGAM